MSLIGLGHHCEQQTRLFWQRIASDSRFCYELFRRALTEPHSQMGKAAWNVLHRQYHHQATLWVKRHKAFPQTRHEPGDLAEMALQKMWISFANSKEDKFGRFPPDPERGLKALLKFLQLCIHSVVIDAVRVTEDLPLPSTDDENSHLEPAAEDPDHLAAEAFWQCIYLRLKNDKERIVVDASYIHNLKPRHIIEMYADEFATVREIHRIKENVLARLRRDKRLRGCFE
ncbi:MAG TPA: hypothetical protein ENK06_00880 [Gammaproteobacteria bacterium]|nr:hypothetical protein [Gammaproteobacteria bacterium]